LGEIFSAQVDKFSHTTDHQPQVLNSLENSIKEGYGAALQIDATNLDALIRLEVCLTSANHSLRSGEKERANESSLKILQWYTKVVNLLEEDSISKYELCFEEQYDLMYNMACAAEICDQEDTYSRALRHL
jgi:hypothetical protein